MQKKKNILIHSNVIVCEYNKATNINLNGRMTIKIYLIIIKKTELQINERLNVKHAQEKKIYKISRIHWLKIEE